MVVVTATFTFTGGYRGWRRGGCLGRRLLRRRRWSWARHPSLSSPISPAMYNGIGLTTPRGSDTNSYIQTNKFFIKPRSSSSTSPYDAAAPAIGGIRNPNKDTLKHDRKCRIELRLLSLREPLADQGYTMDEIEEKVRGTRNGLEEEAREKGEGDRAAAQ